MKNIKIIFETITPLCLGLGTGLTLNQCIKTNDYFPIPLLILGIIGYIVQKYTN